MAPRTTDLGEIITHVSFKQNLVLHGSSRRSLRGNYHLWQNREILPKGNHFKTFAQLGTIATSKKKKKEKRKKKRKKKERYWHTSVVSKANISY